jgi:hypothetical protein
MVIMQLQKVQPTTKIKEKKNKTCKRVQPTNTIKETKKIADQPSSPPVFGRPIYRCLSVNIGIYRYISVETKKLADQPSSPPVFGRPAYRYLSVNIGIYRYISV